MTPLLLLSVSLLAQAPLGQWTQPNAEELRRRGPPEEIRYDPREDPRRRGGGYSLHYTPTRDGSTVFEILEPEGAQVEVWDEGQVVRGVTPLSFPARPDRAYRVMLWARNGAPWRKKLLTDGGMRATLKVRPPEVVVQAAPPPPPPSRPPRGPAPMAPTDFSRLKAAIAAESFSGQKLDVLRTAASSGAFFLVAQVGELVDLYTYSNDKLECVSTVRERIIDRPNAFQLYQHFTYSSDKEKVKQLLQ